MAIVRFLLLGAGNRATFAFNAADSKRHTSKPNDVILGNLVGFSMSAVSGLKSDPVE
jgi:nucleobase:cation symporter-1, NCS1 family